MDSNNLDLLHDPLADGSRADVLNLSLSTFQHHPPPPHPPITIDQRRQHRNPSPASSDGKSLTIPPPHPWSTDRRATVHSLHYLLSHRITVVAGDVECKSCERRYSVQYDLLEKFTEVGSYIAAEKSNMHQRAPAAWCSPTLDRCRFCEEDNSARPVIAEKKRLINWLFLLLGQMLGCCTLDQLKYFCKHTKNHRTGAKDRLLYLTYLHLCRQLDPHGPFDGGR